MRRTAHYLLELGSRLQLVGMGTASGYDCPITQFMLADALGLSAVHLNRVLRQLREKGLLRFQQGAVKFENREQLVALSGFDPGYLDADLPALR